MTFVAFTQPDDAAAAVASVVNDHADTLPPEIHAQAAEFLQPGNQYTGNSIAFQIAYFAELIWARVDEVTDPIPLEVAAGCASYGSLHYVDNLGGSRGDEISKRLRKASGERAPTGGWGLSDDEPLKREQFVKPEEAPAEPAPGE